MARLNNDEPIRFSRDLPNCYIYLYHTDEFFIIPQYPNQINDQLESSFGSQNALSRTAPVFSYNNSGPRTVQVSVEMHRDLMKELNLSVAKVKYNDVDGVVYTPGDDYVDILIKKLQAVALPRYKRESSLVEPPMVAVQLGDEVFIKGVVASGGISVAYDYPVLENNKYAKVTISFTVSEIKPYDADSVGRLGSFRGLTGRLLTNYFVEGKLRDADVVGTSSSSTRGPLIKA